MLNEDKIKLMTGLAMFEKQAVKEIYPVNRYYKNDYIASRMIRSFLGYTVSFLLCMVLWIVYRIELILNSMDPEMVIRLIGKYGIVYLVGLIVYLLITYRVSSQKYEYVSKSMKLYQAKLRRLSRKYEAPAAARNTTERREP